jgi:hypothetical protein
MQHYMRMTTKFLKTIKLFAIQNQVIEDDDVIDKMYEALE